MIAYLRSRCSSRGNRGLLLREDVELVEVSLDIAVADRVILLQAEELAHSRIRVDRVTLTLLGVLELVRLDIRAECLRDISGRHLSAARLAKEGAKLAL